jgi:hypothetical protein
LRRHFAARRTETGGKNLRPVIESAEIQLEYYMRNDESSLNAAFSAA